MLALGALVLALPAAAQRGDDASRRSKNGKVEATIDGVKVTLEFGRPQVRDREVWGSLVPFGQVWRSGADEATTFTIDKDARIEGQALPAGTYSLFTVPGADQWVVVFNKVARQWGAFSYDQGQDQLRVTVKPRAADHEEAMNFEIQGAEVVLRWAKVAVPFTVSKAG
jgi:hypothetical protein